MTDTKTTNTEAPAEHVTDEALDAVEGGAYYAWKMTDVIITSHGINGGTTGGGDEMYGRKRPGKVKHAMAGIEEVGALRQRLPR